MTWISKNVYIAKLAHIVNKYSNTYSKIKIKSFDVKSNTYIDFGIKNNDKDPKNILLLTYVISDIDGEAIVGMFYK